MYKYLAYSICWRQCDIFLYPAALLAQEHINNHNLDIFTAHDLTYQLRVIETQTRVGSSLLASY